MKLSVPYYSQFVDIDDSFWMLRACGGLCLKMVAEFHGKNTPDILVLCNEAKECGGYDMSNGWVHDYIIKKAKDFGLQAYRKEGLTNIDEIITSLNNGNPVIVSVEKRVLEQTRFHMIVIVGHEQIETSQRNANLADNTPETEPGLANSYKLQANGCLYYHETESTDKEKGQYRTCSKDIFLKYWRGKAIFISQ